MRRTLPVLALVILAAALAAGCAEEGNGQGATAAEPTSGRPSGSAGDPDTDVRIQDFGFGPKMLQAEVGQRVRWEHRDVGVTHTVTADEGSFRSGDLTNGREFSHLFQTAGTYPYHCAIHADMRGTVRVGG